jgi:integrase
LELLKEIIGDRDIGLIDYYAARDYRDIYQKLPRNRASTARKKMSIKELIDLNAPDKPSSETVNQRIQTISSFFKWLKTRNQALNNPFEKLRVKRAAGETTAGNKMKKRLPFTTDDLCKLFDHKYWVNHDFSFIWEYWLPLLLLYTGARVTEICQLEKKDFEMVGDVWVMSINDVSTKDEPEEVWPKRLKTANSLRKIPIHSHLIDLGLQKFIDSAPKGRLFPQITAQSDKLARVPCRYFNEFILPKVGIKEKWKKTLYSMRHTTLDALKQKEIPSEQRAQLAGHSVDQENMSEAVYGDEFGITTMRKLVEMLDFSVPMKNVKPWPPSKETFDQLAKKAQKRLKQAASRQANKARKSN